MSIIHLAILGALSVLAGTCLILASWLGSRSGTAAAMRPAQHWDDGTGGGNIRFAMDAATLDRARGDRLIVLPNGGLEIERGSGQERTEEMPALVTAEPVVHVEVTEDVGLDGYAADEPSAELAVPTEAERRTADMHDEALWDNEMWDSRRRHDAAVRRLRMSSTDSTIDAWLRDGQRLPLLIEARRVAHEDVDDPSVEMDAAELAALVAEAKAGATA